MCVKDIPIKFVGCFQEVSRNMKSTLVLYILIHLDFQAQYCKTWILRLNIILNVIWLHLFHLFEKKCEGFIATKSPKTAKMAIVSFMLAFLGQIVRFSPVDHLDIYFCDQQNFRESTLVLYILRYSEFKAQYPEKQGKCP